MLVRAQLITHPGRQFGWASGRSERQMKLQVKLEETFVSLCFNLKIRIDFTLWDGEVQLPRSHSRRFDQAHGGLGWTAFRTRLRRRDRVHVPRRIEVEFQLQQQVGAGRDARRLRR